MKIADQLAGIRNVFDLWLQDSEHKGKVFICSDLYHLWGILFDNVETLKVLVMYNGETQRTTFPGGALTARVDRRFLVVISRGRGLSVVDRGLPLVASYQNARPLFDIVDEARDVCRGLIWDAAFTERPTDFDGIRPFNTEGSGMIVDAYQIEFHVGTQLFMLDPQPTNEIAQG